MLAVAELERNLRRGKDKTKNQIQNHMAIRDASGRHLHVREEKIALIFVSLTTLLDYFSVRGHSRICGRHPLKQVRFCRILRT